MFRTIWSKTLREYRFSIFGWGITLAILVLVTYVAYGPSASDPQSQAALTQLGQMFRFMAEPVEITSPNGFATWRIFTYMPIFLSVWALFAGSALLRREEERQSLDLIVSTPHSRLSVLTQKVLAMVIGLLVIALFIAFGVLLGEASSVVSLDVGRALLAGLNVSLIAFFFGMVALFISQFFRNRGAASGLTGILLALSFLIDGTGRAIENGAWLQAFSPFHYFNINKPLLTNYESHWLEPTLLLLATLILMLASAWLLNQRDIGGIAVPTWPGGKQRKPSSRLLDRAWGNLFNFSTGLRSLGNRIWSSCIWLLCLVLFSLWTTMIIPSIWAPIQQFLESNPVFKQIFLTNHIGPTAFLSGIVFQFGIVIMLIFALAQGMGWINDLESGRFELVLSTPISRTRLLCERFAVILILLAFAPLLTWITIVLTTQAVNLEIDANALAAASAAVFPLEMLIVGVIILLAGWLPGFAVISIVGGYLGIALLMQLLESVLKWPEWLLRVSIFYDYQNPHPLTNGWQWGTMAIMASIGLVCFLIGLWRFRQVDMQRG